jgi:methylenetetrahydrofolate reductase (NADPH)
MQEREGMAANLLSGETPEALLTEIAAAQAADPSLGFVSAHFFTFGSLRNLANWLRTLD